ncbi:hypothetical protein B1C78_00285 [Thioalkalivibrio denitrificans]|uniref:Uncharacterized protein n=1 Tax=Thioalkalivibrio denitrificans TaxID=108003 RepID=A0A1V3NUM0_9GAMM|nr:hypothetical protein [Thioalkalivibrio denitrificans]OOG28817.1 hypothetical protein B1C78_00285 [Thioalkalivibrio denitrificans]
MRRNPIVTAIGVTGMVALLSGCVATGASGKQYRIGLDGIREVPKEEAAASDAANEHRAKAPVSMLGFAVTTSLDVDTAYVRIRRHFGFQTFEERTRGLLVPSLTTHDRGYHHRITPGVQYSLRQPGVENVAGYQDPLQIDIDREGQGTRLYVQFYAHNAPGGPQAFERHLRSELTRALQ